MSCGTEASYRRHLRADGRVTCRECLDARAARKRQSYQYSNKAVMPCGTIAGYQRHKRAGQEACYLCKAAWSTYNYDLRHGIAEADAIAV